MWKKSEEPCTKTVDDSFIEFTRESRKKQKSRWWYIYILLGDHFTSGIKKVRMDYVALSWHCSQ